MDTRPAVGCGPVRLLFASLFAALCLPATAVAGITSVTPIDGPTPDIVDFGGVSMAPDGTGGIVYRKRVDGHPHVFAAQFDGKAWRPAQRVDAGQRYESSWPVIGAGNGGRLVVAWVQEFGPSSDRLFSAALDPGARRFQAPVPVDLNVGEATGTHPSLAMNTNGTAYLSYLAMRAPTPAEPAGYARGELRVARYDTAYWTGIGFPLNRNVQAPLRLPVAGASPRVTIDQQGNGILAWQEVDDGFVDRIWARRLFGGQAGIAVQVSPGTWESQPLRAPADRFDLDLAGFGQGAIAYRQQPGGTLPAARIMLATIPETYAPNANVFGAPRALAGDAPGPPSVAVDRVGDTATAFGLAQRSIVIGADERAVREAERLDDGRTAIPGDPQVDLAASGASVAAWVVRRGASGGIGVTERRADGVPTTQTVAAPAGGVVSGFALSGSGLGDGIVGWLQGGQIAAVVVDAPPDGFTVEAPLDYVRTAPTIRWDTPQNAIGAVSYTVTIDDDTVAENLSVKRLKLRARDLDDGVHVLQVVATDEGGQETTSAPSELRFDNTPPRVTVRRYRNGLTELRLTDRASGVDRTATKIDWGDGTRNAKRVHRYRGGARPKITVRVRDKAGNRTTVRK